MNQEPKEIKKEKEGEDLFPFYYVGGGYFRRKGIAKGIPAETLHGMEAIKYLLDKFPKNK